MNDFNSVNAPIKGERLKFIDMARSIAILLMLQGHFITLTFRDYKPMISDLRIHGTSGYLLFDWFVKIRGFTAPLFFTITGMVFMYLLVKSSKTSPSTSFLKNERVKKGIRRAISIIFWAYLIQINLKYFKYYLRGNVNNQLFAFHILQSIGFGILILLLIFGLQKLINKGSLILYYFLGGVIVFLLQPYFDHLAETDFFPKYAPRIIQNMFHGPKSEFPLIPWLGFVLFGGMLGVMLNHYQRYTSKKWFPLVTLFFGVTLLFFGRYLGKIFDYLFKMMEYTPLRFEKNAWVYDRLAEVILFLGLLMFIEKVFKIKNSLFLKIGQNTLPIYILHVIILYGAVTGYSLKSVYKSNLSPIESIIGAICFILFFALFIKYIETIMEKISKVKMFINLKVKSLFKGFRKSEK